jgi:WD40 repeat protein
MSARSGNCLAPQYVVDTRRVRGVQRPPGVRVGRTRHVPTSAMQQSSLDSPTYDDCFVPCGMEDGLMISVRDQNLIGRCAPTLTSVQQAHSGAVTALVMMAGRKDSDLKVLSAGMDKTVSIWNVGPNGLSIEKRIILQGGPCHSVLVLPQDSILMGTHSKSILAWSPSKSDLDTDAYSVIENHCGWVRTMTTNGRWLFSAACNEIKQFDRARAVPSLVTTKYLDKGDILTLCCTKEKLFVGTVDGCLHSFTIDKTGALVPGPSRAKAHNGRVTDLKTHKGLLISSSYDGSIKSWGLEDLEIVGVASDAHSGERVSCLAIGEDGVLYSGGSDGAVRAWDSNVLDEIDVICTHDQPIRSLSLGLGRSLCAGTAEGSLVFIGTSDM